ncbi:MAG TPA: ABC transporter substrate-binding protein [Caldilineaceae bacterium]|nr:ABC transporter substrate-binding protein [Caldilineaceae bacterium]
MTDPANRDLMHQAQEEYRRAHDFDRRDPLFGLSKNDLSGPRLSRRTVMRLMAAAGTLTLAQVVAACAAPAAAPSGSTQSGEAAAPTTATGGELVAGWAGVAEIQTLDPAQINQVLQFQIASNVLSGLTHIDPSLTGQGDLAVDWNVSDDGLEWTFNLREGVTWHDGAPFSADDVVFTYNRSKDPAQSIHSAVIANILDCQKVDDLTVKLVLEAPQASLLTKTLERSSGRAMTIVSQKAIEELGLEQYGLTPVGTGPFRVTEHQLGQGVVIERFENYYDPERPKLDKVTFIPIPEPEPLAAAIEAGDIQLIGGNAPAAELIDRFLANPELVVSEVTGPGFQAIFINPWREPMMVTDFNKPLDELKAENGFKVRLALAKAFDRDTFIERALFGRGRPGFGTVNPAMGFFFDTTINEKSEQRFELEVAQQLLADAGFPGGEGFPTLKLLTTPPGRRAGEVIANMYQENLGITVELDIKDFTVLIEDGNSMNYDLMALGSGGDYDPDDALVDWMQTSSKFNGPNRDTDTMPFGFFSDAEVDALTDEQRTLADPEERRALVQQANQITSDKVAAIFTHHPTDILVYRTEVTFPDESRIPGLVDLDRTTISS